MTQSSRLLDLAQALVPDFAARARGGDERREISSENYAALKAHKLLSVGVPSELGGGGASHAELCELLRVLAHGCPSTSLALSMHTHLVSAGVWRHLHGQPTAPLLRKVAEGELVLVSTGAGDWLESTGRATRVEGGFAVTAQKRFASGSPMGDLALTSAPYDDPQEGAQVLHFAVSLRANGVRIDDDWDTLGMRATGSNTLHFEEVFVPDAAISLRRPRGQWHPSLNVVCVVALPILLSSYVGLAEQAAELARAAARKRPPTAGLIALLGEMDNALETARLSWRAMIEAARDYAFEPLLEHGNTALMRKTIAAEAVRRCLDRAMAASGGAAFFRVHPLERLFRDAQAVQFHPLPEKAQLEFTGRVALGLPPVG